MDPILLQKQLRDNNTDLHDYYKDIQSWGDEMKRKEAALKNAPEKPDVPLPRKKVSKKDNKPDVVEITPAAAATSKAPKDFSYWEKFDVDAECEKIDHAKSDDDSDLTDEHDEATIELAQEEKEKGNKFVKAGCWKDALKCYTQAIAYFNYDATFYANRALCHLKLQQYKNAEADCTIAIQLDEKYVKALHRRALAKEALKQYMEAKEDLEKILVLEPENKESQKLLDKIDQVLKPVKVKPAQSKVDSNVNVNFERPISKFTASRQNKPVALTGAGAKDSKDVGPAFKELVVERKKPQTTKVKQEEITTQQKRPITNTSLLGIPSILWPVGTGDDIEIVKSFNKSPKDRSRVPLKRVQVGETSSRSLSKT